MPIHVPLNGRVTAEQSSDAGAPRGILGQALRRPHPDQLLIDVVVQAIGFDVIL
jgi:hypothetical protein